MLNAPAFALLTTRPPAELRAQVMTFFVTANLLAGPVAYVAAGPLFAHFGLAPVLIGVAIGVTLCAGLLFTFLRPAAAGQDDAGPFPAAVYAFSASMNRRASSSRMPVLRWIRPTASAA